LREPAASGFKDALACAADITDELAVERFAAGVHDRFGRVDVLVNNAGVSFIAPAETVSAQDYRRVLEVNLVAPFLLARIFGQRTLAAGRGSIVNIVPWPAFSESPTASPTTRRNTG
jgi:NAD(P)-dependent dehydrogenase (short-subunit alcohol dehydrogenase family)